MKKPYNNINTNPELNNMLIKDAVTINTQPNAMLGEFPEYTKDGIKVFNPTTREYELTI